MFGDWKLGFQIRAPGCSLSGHPLTTPGRIRICLILCGLSFGGLCLTRDLLWGQPNPAEPVDIMSPEPLQLKGLHNVHRIADWLFSGSSPDNDSGFESLKTLGIKTIITVDGARPDIETAKRLGMRYVHIPIGYDGIPREKVLQLARAARDLPRPLYVHCHHGKHRGPAAAAAVHLCLDDQCHAQHALLEMKTFGTDPRYQGLFETIRHLTRPTPEQLDELPDEFPEVARIGSFTERMVEVDVTWDHLKAIRAAGWKAPLEHPDLVPAQEALQLLEHYREAARLPEVDARPAEFRTLLHSAESSAETLESALRNASATPQVNRLNELFKQSESHCNNCHQRFRDVQQ